MLHICPGLRQLQTAGDKPSLIIWDLWDVKKKNKQFVESYTGGMSNVGEKKKSFLNFLI